MIVESGAEGLKLSWSPDQIKQSRKAAWAETASPDTKESSGSGLGHSDESHTATTVTLLSE